MIDPHALAEGVFARMPPALQQELKRRASYLMPLAAHRIPVVSLRGAARSGEQPATMLVAGAEHWVSYLASRFFADAPRREIVGQAPVWALARVLRRLRPSADLTIAHIDRLSAQLYFDDDYLTVPDWIGALLPMPVDLERLARTRNSVSDDIRNTRCRWHTVEFAHAAADFEIFYDRMYLPYAHDRHGMQTYVYNKYLLRRAFRRGGILHLIRDGSPLAGALFERNGSTLIFVALGVVNGDMALLRQGAVAALYVHLLDYAREQGCTAIDFRGSRPSLLDGVLRYKRKWGATLYDKRDVLHATLVHWNRLDDVVAEFLAHTPLIFRDGDGLSAVAVVDRPAPWTAADLRRERDKLWVTGLRKLSLIANAEGPFNLPIPPDTQLLSRKTLSNAGPRALLTPIGASPRDTE